MKFLSTSICIQLCLVSFVKEDKAKRVYCYPIFDVTEWLLLLDDARYLFNAVIDLIDALSMALDVIVKSQFEDRLIFGVG